MPHRKVINPNDARVNRGMSCIRHWRERAGENPDMPIGQEDVVDLVTDALHFAAKHGMDLEAITRMAKAHVEHEITVKED